MILNFMINNYRVFNSEVNLSLEADLRTQKLISNVIANPHGNALKSVAIYGPNNTGKTCIIKAIAAYRSVLLNEHSRLANRDKNLFTDSDTIKLGAEFVSNNSRYAYCFSYDVVKQVFSQEKFVRIVADQYKNTSETIYFYRNLETNEIDSYDPKLKDVIKLSSKENILIYSLETADLPLLQEAKDVLQDFANNLYILSMERLSPKNTIKVLKYSDNLEAKQVIELIKSADLDIDDFRYDDNTNYQVMVKKSDGEEETDDNLNNSNFDVLKLISIHHGMPLPSILFDSAGTKKIVSLASYIVHVLNNKGILVLDELDNGIHFKLSRAIVSLFNNLLNESAQLICTTHDVSLLDIKTLFRKEQLWFTDKGEKQAYLYSLADFTASESGIRSESNLYDHYRKGLLGALPDPSLIDFLLKKGEEASDE